MLPNKFWFRLNELTDKVTLQLDNVVWFKRNTNSQPRRIRNTMEISDIDDIVVCSGYNVVVALLSPNEKHGGLLLTTRIFHGSNKVCVHFLIRKDRESSGIEFVWKYFYVNAESEYFLKT